MLREGFVHFSDLKKFALAPAFYRASLEEELEVTKAMRVGTIVHRLSLGGANLVVWEGDRRGGAWKAFQAAHAGVEIMTRKEVDEAQEIADALVADPMAKQFLEGSKHEVPLTWKMGGFTCRTRGVDIIGDGWLADLKVTNSTHPDRWRQHAFSMLYHAQIAFYEEACRQNGYPTNKGQFLVGIENKKPHPVTALKLTPRALEEGRKCIGLWLNQLQVAIESNDWGPYVRSVIDLDVEEDTELTIGGKKFDWNGDDGEEHAA